jgi:hypothetical protein
MVCRLMPGDSALVQEMREGSGRSDVLRDVRNEQIERQRESVTDTSHRARGPRGGPGTGRGQSI